MPKIDYNELNGIALLLQQARLEILSDCESYEQNLHEFSSDTGLSGKSWSNAKQHAENVAPVVKALANALSQTGEVFSNYLSSFQSEVGSPKNRLDTDKLLKLNDRLKQTRASKKAVLQQIEKLKDFPSNQIMGSSGSDYAILAFDSAMGTMHRDIEILEKYRSFETAHARDFAEVLQAFEAIQSGLKAINAGDTFSSGSGYQTKNMQKEAWMTTLATYNERQPKTHTEYVKRYQVVTDENGLTKTFVVYEIYTNGEYDYLKSQQVAELMQEAQMEKGKEFLLEITSVNDFIRTFKGVDPITGEKLSSQERGFAALMAFITVVSAGTAVKMLKNARRGAALMKDVDVAGEVSRIESKVGGVEKAIGANVPKVEIPEQSLKHSNVGDFTVNPSTGKVSKMKGGGHGQSNIDFLKENGFEVNIEKTYPNGVRTGNVPDHKVKAKRIGNNQSWFPENWTNKDIENAGKYVASQPDFASAKDGEAIFHEFKGVRVGVIKTDGKAATVFPDATTQP